MTEIEKKVVRRALERAIDRAGQPDRPNGSAKLEAALRKLAESRNLTFEELQRPCTI